MERLHKMGSVSSHKSKSVKVCLKSPIQPHYVLGQDVPKSGVPGAKAEIPFRF